MKHRVAADRPRAAKARRLGSIVASVATVALAFGVSRCFAVPPPSDPATRAWWATTAALSNDAMEGRDTGSPGYDRAARVVADRFSAAGLVPMGERGTWYQNVPMDEIRLERAVVTVGRRSLILLHDVSLTPTASMPATVDAPLAYRGYCGPDALGDVRGKLVVCHGTRRRELPGAADRDAAVKAAGGIGILSIADPGFTVEPPRWPFAYARNVLLAGAKPDVRSVPAHDAQRRRVEEGARTRCARRDRIDRRRKPAAAPLPSFDLPGFLPCRLHDGSPPDRLAQHHRAAARQRSCRSPTRPSSCRRTSTATATARRCTATRSTTARSTTRPTSRC